MLLLNTYHGQNWFLCNHLPWSFKFFINVFAFLYVEANFKECEWRSILSFFFQNNADASIVVEIQG